jgi:transcriptional regulator with XRE-family HTH domain
VIADGPLFVDWLRAEMKAQRISQRRLAARAGVNHATISRLLRLKRDPSMATASRLARALNAVDSPTAFYVSPLHPTVRVEHALRADESLSEAQVREIMEIYLATRSQRRPSVVRVEAVS